MTEFVPKNNAKRRRLFKELAKVKGRKVAYNEAYPRAALRKAFMTFTKCPDCGDRMLVRNLDWHRAKALLHVKTKTTRKRKEKVAA